MRPLSSKICFLIHNKTVFKTLFYELNKNTYNKEISEKAFNKKARLKLNYKFDCENPKSFNEYLCWMKLHYRNDLWKRCADKLEMKNFLKEIGLEDFCPKVIGIYKNSGEINLDALPEKFVLKTNNDSGTVFVCKKGITDFSKIFIKLDEAIKRKYNNAYGEWVYEDINPLIFAEEYLEPIFGDDLIDYKLFIYNGKYKWGYVAQNRQADMRITVIEDDFVIQNVEYMYLKPRKNNLPKRPPCFIDMINIAEKVGKHFDFVRVDFYMTKQGIKIGELTFFSFSGTGSFTNKEYDFKYGHFFAETNIAKLINS